MVAVVCLEVEEAVVSLVLAELAVVDSVEEDVKELEMVPKLASLVAVILLTNQTVSLGSVTKCVSITVVGRYISGPPASVFIAVGTCSSVTVTYTVSFSFFPPSSSPFSPPSFAAGAVTVTVFGISVVSDFS